MTTSFLFGYTLSGDIMSILLLVASFLWGLNIVIMKLLMEYIPAILLSTTRILLSCLVIVVMLWKKNSLHNLKKIPKKECYWLCFISFFSVFLNFYLSFIGIQLLSGSSSALINGMQPMVTCVVAFLFLKIIPTKKAILGIILTIIGFLFSIKFQFQNLEMGHLLLFSSLVVYCIGNVFIQKKLKDIDQLVINFYNFLFGGFYLSILVTMMNGWDIHLFLSIPWYLMIAFFIVSVVGYAYIQYVTINGIKKIGADNVSFYLNLNPVFTYVSSLLLLGEHIERHLLIGLSLIIVSTYFANK